MPFATEEALTPATAWPRHGGCLLLPREAIVGLGRPVGGVAGAHHALPHGCALKGKAGARMHHRRAPGVDGGDDLLRGDSLQVGAGRDQRVGYESPKVVKRAARFGSGATAVRRG